MNLMFSILKYGEAVTAIMGAIKMTNGLQMSLLGRISKIMTDILVHAIYG